MPWPNNSHNIALQKDVGIWDEDLYDLRMFGGGYCYTYNPPRESTTDFGKRMFMLLGHLKENADSTYFIGYQIYLHEKGQFWPRPGMEMIGQ